MTTLKEFAEQMQAYQRASGVPLSEVKRRLHLVEPATPRVHSIEDWERACADSLERARARRRLLTAAEAARSPWPRRGEVLVTFAIVAVVAVVLWVFVWSSWAAFG